MNLLKKSSKDDSEDQEENQLVAPKDINKCIHLMDK